MMTINSSRRPVALRLLSAPEQSYVVSSMAVLLLTVMSVAGSAKADDTHHEGLPIGNQALGLGGAYTGVAWDGSAAYHNPAGLTSPGGDKFAGGLTLFGFDSFEVSNAVADRLGSGNFSAKRRGFLPIFGATVKTFGPKVADGRKRFAVAYSSAQPRRTNRTFDVILDGREAIDADTVRLEQNYRTVYHGLSFAWLASPKWSFGLTSYLSITRAGQEEQSFLSDGANVNPDTGAIGDGTALAIVERYNAKVFHIVLRLGTTFDVHHKLRLGLMVQLPGIPFIKKGKYRQQSLTADANQAEVFFRNVSSKARAPIPFSFRLGAGYRPTADWLLSGDIGFVAPIRSRAIISGVTSEDTEDGLFNNDTKRNAVVNVALGLERQLGENAFLRVGGFTDFSSAPKIASTPSEYATEQIHRFGVSAATGFEFSALQMSFGTTLIIGRGDAVGIQSNLVRGEVTYDRVSAKSRTVMIHISGATTAAKDIAKWFERDESDKHETSERK